ncbi:MAG: AMP-binding protein [Acidimicrobiia bacterium]|nr:AMP-binding protein [Acidimicrobiia bacterium]
MPDAATIPAMAALAAERFGDRLAIADGETRLSYADLVAEARRFGAALVAAGIDAGERVSIWAFNSAEWVIALLGLSMAGATLVPINTRWKGAEAADVLRRSRARLLVTVAGFLGTDYVGMLEGEDLPDLETIVVARSDSWDEFLARVRPDDLDEVDRRAAAVAPRDPADVLFTSGTTGAPKGVVMPHERTLGVASDWVRMTGLHADDRYLMVNPYFHQFGLKAGILACLASGAAMLPQPVFDVERVLERVAEEKVTVLPGAPTLYLSILDHADRDKHDLSTLRVAVTGAADIPVELIRRINKELPFSLVVTGYGLTETGTATSTSPDDDFETVATTVGRPRPGFEVRIDDSEGNELPIGEAGEVVVKGPTVMAGYLDDADATAAALSDDGWLRTGDLGVLDERGCLRIVGRIKDMFIVGGFNVYPAEIENALLRHPDVLQAAVIGVPDARLGEVGMAFVVGESVDPYSIIAWCRDQMANYKVPRAVKVVDELPLNATGKVMKDELRARAANR